MAVEACFKVTSQAKGWAGFGLGAQMAGADMYIAYVLNNEVKFENYLGVMYDMPGAQKQSAITSFEGSTTGPKNGLTFTFCRNSTSMSNLF